MKRKIFISYDFSDATFKGEIEVWLLEMGLEVISVNKRDLTPEAKREAKKRIKVQICESDLLLILVGNNTHNRPFVDYEVAVAKSVHVPTYLIRLSDKRGAPPAEVRSIECIEFSKSDVLNLLIRLGLIK